MDNDLRNKEINISLVQIGLFIRLLSICGSSYRWGGGRSPVINRPGSPSGLDCFRL